MISMTGFDFTKSKNEVWAIIFYPNYALISTA